MDTQSPLGIVWAALTPESEKELFRWITPQFPKRFHSHVTLAFRVTKEEFEQQYPGVLNSYRTIHVVSWSTDSARIQAASVSLEGSGLVSTNKQPHITLSAIESAKPVESNTMLEAPTHIYLFHNPLPLQVIVEFSPFS